VLHILQRVLQSVLQLVAECLYRIDNEEGRSAAVLQCVSACCSVRERVAVCCFAECCSVLQRVAICCSIEEDERRARSVLQWVAVGCDVLRCVAVSRRRRRRGALKVCVRHFICTCVCT